jgi:hypothetical protein
MLLLLPYRVVIVEEAGEILKAYMLTSLGLRPAMWQVGLPAGLCQLPTGAACCAAALLLPGMDMCEMSVLSLGPPGCQCSNT